MEGFFADRRREDLLLLYFSCHGVKDPDGRLYFAAANTKVKRLGATGVPAQFVNDQMGRSRSRRIVLLLDCCYSGAFSRLGTKSDPAIHLQERFDGSGRVVLTASDAMEYAFEGEALSMDVSTPSVFTAAVVQGLRSGEADRDADGRISVDDLYEYVFEQVQARTDGAQTPGMFADVHGNIYLARSRRLPAGAPVPDLDPSPTRPAPPIQVPDPEVSAPARPPRSPDRRWLVIVALSVAVVLLATVGGVVASRRGGGPPSSTASAWQRLPDAPVALEAGATTTYAGALWVAGGISAAEDRAKLDSVQVYDPASRTWRAGPRLPLPLSHAALVSTGSDLWLLGGWSAAGAESGVYRLDRPDGQWLPGPPLPAGRVAGAAAWDGSRIVFGGGVGLDQVASADVWALQDGAWRALPPLQVGREKLAAVTDSNGTVWFVGGRDRARPDPLYGAVDEVTSAGTRSLGEAVEAVEGPAAVWWPGAGPCLLGGATRAGVSAAVRCLRPLPTGTTLPDLPRARAGLGAAVLDGTVYAVGGYDGGEHGTGQALALRS